MDPPQDFVIPIMTDRSSASGTQEEIIFPLTPISPVSKDHIFDVKGIKDHIDLLAQVRSEQEGEEVSLAPIVAGRALNVPSNVSSQSKIMFPKLQQYGLLAGLTPIMESQNDELAEGMCSPNDPRVFYNVTSPSSTFICGSQGSGKSHTLSCMLENCLLSSKAGHLEHPLTGLLFHYDSFIGDTMGSPCEAAYLSSNPDVKVRVLCSPTNFRTVGAAYSRLKNVEVEPLQIDESDLNTQRMLDLMAASQGDGPMPLYMHTVLRILRELRTEQQETGAGFNYEEFKSRLLESNLTSAQIEPLKQRLDTLESFLSKPQIEFGGRGKKSKKVERRGSVWDPVPGRLTIVDLSCPCISPDTACGLFNICLGIFLEQDQSVGRVVALDEAHKYMNSSAEASAFTNTLLMVVRLQRHLGVRVIISTQEPTISTALLNLCSVTIVHRFTSPEWLRVLRHHLAGASDNCFASKTGSEVENDDHSEEDETEPLFDKIVRLGVGQALLFAPNATVRTTVDDDGKVTVHQLGARHLTVKTRARLTEDGGKTNLSM
ncbi:uncharacterized protein KD926_000062 [Aspergillus affinis]|uniref:uncharacterized protein n=1 Tax=Aspergillus affinis TaxID=1070780 RepID=UPI0022FF3471|nr:uncharacterized protein KD926_000062 [Aspergillus affinis]KAI9037721.1 hypothetical protein KD926_000062 [Aspergillus affinis]